MQPGRELQGELVRTEARDLLDRAFARSSGAPLRAGNAVQLLRDAAENYPAWLDAIRGAQRSICFEMYILYDDAIGREFAEALADKARAGVRVRLLYDWFGNLGKSGGRFWNRLRSAGVDVRCFNALQPSSPFGWLHRDHRKTISVDGRRAFVSGLCIGQPWVGDATRGIDAWRDTGVELCGPAVADVEAAFARIWVESGGAAIPEAERTAAESIPACGEVSLRVVASVPWTAGILRMDQLVASAAVQKLWLTDAYFAGTPPYVEALRAAALDGVDVRLLVPGGSDIPILQPLTHAGYRPLLEAGVRVFEWRGPMLHAKTAVADGRWARVGSSNLNLASWIGNYELDVSVEHAGFATEMERAFQADLESSDEIVLSLRPRRASRTRGEKRSAPGRSGSASRAAVGALRVGNTVGAAISNQRLLGHSQARMVTLAGLALLLLVGLTAFFPRWLTIPGLLLGTWVGLALLVRGIGLFWKRRRQQIPKTRVVVAKAAPQGRAP